MYGGLLKSTSAVAMLAAAGLFANASAADLGGDCCADLEERVAELESTTVRKGNRKVSLKISGFVGSQVMYWDDGTQSDTYVGMDGGNIFSRWRFTGSAKISPEITAGFTYEFGLNRHSISGANQGNGSLLNGSGAGDDGGECTNSCIRDTTVWLRHARLGMVKIGQGSTATDNLILIDLGQKGVGSTPDSALYNGSFALRGNNGQFAGNGSTVLNWGQAIRGHESFDTSRRNHVLYETPTIFGFTAQAAIAEDNFWDVALRYAGEFGGFRFAAGVGYQEDGEFNAPNGAAGSGIAAGNYTVICNNNCDVTSKEVKGSASLLHVPTGLFVTGAGGQRQLDGRWDPGVYNSDYAGPDLTWWYVSGGISKNFFGVGKTVLYGEYLDSKGGLEQSAFLSTVNNNGYAVNQTNTGRSSSEVQMWGVGVTQYLDAAAMELFATYKNYSLDASGFTNEPALNKNSGGVSDFSTVIVGTKINF
ncbi:MAG: porin [Hyphomicrobiaceae bacterium]